MKAIDEEVPLGPEWYDWRWQVRNRITTVERLKGVVSLDPDEERSIRECLFTFRMAITPYYASLIDRGDPACPIRRQAVPSPHELRRRPAEMVDPLAEDANSPVPGIIHRYPDRVLFVVTDQCAMYCRHCTRRRFVGHNDRPATLAHLERGIAYIRSHEEVRDVLVSGGDPLLLSEARLDWLLGRLRAIPHVEVIRIGTRVPAVLPMRVTDALCRVISRHHPVYINVHFNHPRELTPEAARACAALADAGVPLGNQTVLLRGINDCPTVMKRLMHGLLKMRVRPYYLYQCDMSVGLEHFRTPISTGIEMMELLRGHTSGLAVPTFVVDAPGGGGKVPIGPQYMLTRIGEQVVLRNYEGMICVYTEPADTGPGHGACPLCGGEHGWGRGDLEDAGGIGRRVPVRVPERMPALR